MKTRKCRVITRCVADQYAASNERIIEFSAGGKGGLIAFRVADDGTLMVDAYRLDPGVIVRGAQS